MQLQVKKNISQHLDQLEHTSKETSVNFVIGRSDYNPSREDEGVAKWEEFERQAAVGMCGALHENFMGSVQIMDQNSDNSQMPFTVVNGKIDNFIQPIHKFLFSRFFRISCSGCGFEESSKRSASIHIQSFLSVGGHTHQVPHPQLSTTH